MKTEKNGISEFENFRQFTEEIVSVPKAEVERLESPSTITSVITLSDGRF